MATHEHTINVALAEVLRETRQAWRTNPAAVSAEETSLFKGSAKRPDILVLEPDTSPVTVETEIAPGFTAEADALSRLGEQLQSTGQAILSSIAVRTPGELATLQGSSLRDHLKTSKFELAVFTGINQAAATRWPLHGWITGDLHVLSELIQWASVPPAIIDRAADALSDGVNHSAELLGQASMSHPGALDKVAAHLHQPKGAQTYRMVGAILANAMLFQEALAGGPGGLAKVKSLDSLETQGLGIIRQDVLREWAKILEVNYWPIFDIARRLLADLPSPACDSIIDILHRTTGRLLKSRLMRSHDLTGAVFQRLIADRKFLAAYYTTPSAASLLIGLLIDETQSLESTNWADGNAVSALRVADFACGTGTLLSTLYRRIGQLHEFAGGDSEFIHPAMMATGVSGCDVLPAAAHLTASMLSGVHPTSEYEQSSIHTVPYGQVGHGGVALGALDLLDRQSSMEALSITAKALTGTGEKVMSIQEMFPVQSFDVVVMNPPFTRSTNHEGDHSNVPNPAFAAFGTTPQVQAAMAKRLKAITQGTASHGNAGEGSAFVVLADRELKKGGMLGFILPLSSLAGSSWSGVRNLFASSYGEICAGSIAADRGFDASFSADTGMAECIVVAQKTGKKSTRGLFFILKRRPNTQLEGAQIARELRKHAMNKNARSLEDGPFGGEPIRIGTEEIGQSLRGPVDGGAPWRLNRIADFRLAQAAYQLTEFGRIWLPGMIDPLQKEMAICAISDIATVGKVHRDISEDTVQNGVPRGPFRILKSEGASGAPYPALWAHDAKRETRLMIDPDSEALLKKGLDQGADATIKKKASAIWATASHLQFNTDFRFNSQPLAVCYTAVRSIGGRAWPGIKLKDEAGEKVLALWMNSTLGLLVHWIHANKTQNGRGSIPISSLSKFPVLNVRSLNKAAIARGNAAFDNLCTLSLKPAHELDRDESRRLIDQAILSEVLELPAELLGAEGPVPLLRRLLAREPSMNGGKMFSSVV